MSSVAGDARRLGRTEAAVRNLCWRREWRKEPPRWTPAEDRRLIDLYAQHSEKGFLDLVARALGRSRASVACRANELGITLQKGRPVNLAAVRKLLRHPRVFAATRNGRGASTHGGFRQDLGIYVRSRWEANYARYLEWLKNQGDITDWVYEPDTFEFLGIKRGTRFYTPDFRVTKRDGAVEYHEVKGYLSPKAKTALRRMARYYPDVRVSVVTADRYKALRRQLSRVVTNWE